MRKSCTACRNSVPPGMRANLPRNRPITSSALMRRSSRAVRRDEHAAGIGCSALAAGKGDDAGHGRIFADRGGKPRQQMLHRLVRRVLVGHDRTGQASGVLLREEAFRNDDVQVDRKGQREQGHEHGDPLMAQDASQRDLVGLQHEIEEPLAGPIQPAMTRSDRGS